VDLVQRRSERDTGSEVGFKRDSAALVVPANLGRTLAETDVGNGLEGYSPAACRGYWEVFQRREVASGGLEQTHPDGYLTVREGELGTVLVEITQSCDTDRLTDTGDGDAELGSQVEPRLDENLGPLQVAVDPRVAQLRQRAHLIDHFLGGLLGKLRIVSDDEDVDVAPTTTTGLLVEMDLRIRDGLQLLEHT